MTASAKALLKTMLKSTAATPCLEVRAVDKAPLIRTLFGGGKGIRTPDPLHAMQVLYQLSYTPKGSMMLAVELLGAFGKPA